MKLFITAFSPPSFYFQSIRRKYSFQHEPWHLLLQETKSDTHTKQQVEL
jgi:hypothetical protein